MRRYPVVTGDETVRALERAGFVFNRRRGSHVILKDHARGKRVVVPCHSGQTLPPGTLLGLLHQAGLTVDEFSALLKRH